MKKIIITLTLLITSMVIFAQTPEDRGTGIAKMNAPKWNVEYWIDGTGEEFTIDRDDYIGKVVYLLCFQHSDLKSHEKGFKIMKEVYEAYKDNPDVRFIAIQTVIGGHEVNSSDKLKVNQKKHSLPIPFGHDQGSERNKNKSFVTMDYQTGGTPWIVIISKNNNVLFNDDYVTAEDAKLVIKKELRGW